MDKETCHIDIIEYYSATAKKETRLIATLWMDLEGIMLSEVSQADKDKYHMISLYVESLSSETVEWWLPG